MTPCILFCDTCGATVPEMGATPEQKAAMLPIRDSGNLMLRRRAASVSRAALVGSGATKCHRCSAGVEAPKPVEVPAVIDAVDEAAQ